MPEHRTPVSGTDKKLIATEKIAQKSGILALSVKKVRAVAGVNLDVSLLF